MSHFSVLAVVDVGSVSTNEPEDTYVVIGDSLRGPLRGSGLFPIPGDGYEIWYTPMWCHPVWEQRRRKELRDWSQPAS